MNVVKIDAETRKELRSSMDYLARVEERADAEGKITAGEAGNAVFHLSYMMDIFNTALKKRA